MPRFPILNGSIGAAAIAPFLLPVLLAAPPAMAEPAVPGTGLILGLAPAVGPIPAGPFWRMPAPQAGLAHVPPLALAPEAPGIACRAAIAAAEAANAIPAHLLQAIGLVESGRALAGGGHAPWPWAADIDGSGAFYPDAAAAIRAVQAAEAGGTRSIDVGCMQVNLKHHPNAFASLDQAFDPAANAAYAAQFLRALYDRTHDWAVAAASYHSETPALAAPYRARVMAAWAGLGGAAPPEPATGGFASPFAPASPMALAAPMGRFRILPAAPAGGTAPPGRSLAFYRARPIQRVGPLPVLALRH